jgi:hypothetical protein
MTTPAVYRYKIESRFIAKRAVHFDADTGVPTWIGPWRLRLSKAMGDANSHSYFLLFSAMSAVELDNSMRTQ